MDSAAAVNPRDSVEAVNPLDAAAAALKPKDSVEAVDSAVAVKPADSATPLDSAPEQHSTRISPAEIGAGIAFVVFILFLILST